MPSGRMTTVHGLAEHLHAMSTLKSRYKIWILYIRLLLFTIPTTRDRRTSNRCSLKHRTRVAYFRWPKYKKTNINALSCPHKGWVFPQDLFWGSFTSHNSGNYLRHGINITTNQRISPAFRGNGNTIIVGDSQTSPLPIFPEGRGTFVHILVMYLFLVKNGAKLRC